MLNLLEVLWRENPWSSKCKYLTMLLPWVYVYCSVQYYNSHYSYREDKNLSPSAVLSMKIKTTNTIIVFPNKNILSGLWKNKDSFPFYPENSSSEGVYVKLSTWNNLVLFEHLLKKLSEKTSSYSMTNCPQTFLVSFIEIPKLMYHTKPQNHNWGSQIFPILSPFYILDNGYPLMLTTMHSNLALYSVLILNISAQRKLLRSDIPTIPNFLSNFSNY